MIEPNIITVWMHVNGRGQKDAINGLVFCEEIVAAINRDPDRRAEIEPHKDRPWCRVIDYSRPIKVRGYKSAEPDANLIIDWEPMKGYDRPGR